MRIGNVKIPGNILLAPMSNVTNLPFRLMCKKYGASMTYTEMISSDAVIYENTKTFNRGKSSEAERPFGIQVFGNDPQVISRAAHTIEENYHPDIIDLNCGCPAKLLTKDGFGSALLRSPELIHSIIRELSGTVSAPVTAKIRILEDMEKTLEIARLIEDAGASALTVHGRTRQQQYSGMADMEYAKRIREELSIPVIVNGDIVDEKSAEHALEYTCCDGIMIGRAAMGNPFLFKRISHYLDTGEMLEYDECMQRVKDIREYFRLLEECGLMETINVRAHAQWFTRGIRNGRHIRNRIAEAHDVDEIILQVEKMCGGQ
ncbi:tRNA dihydrouridine synthase DusB [Methanolobus zinderi]|jgi:nifR3 family TIM-barrel protein|uniref:tRNA dihydrouridine synthase DusB n=1 Tax=Methanolobus zinderi TaxID=536044 RepID=A0A7D5I7C9_9EURY|nr:tRNA dihydrouridine synthase DusB [Methanolobus zinderi]KXS43815.1 MAG: dihydrouridine synthase like protein [Methanolobus sp. T82-4]QLC48982.1 tRNA dihydrouridine synthase DusB [Methanolobus zinderi]